MTTDTGDDTDEEEKEDPDAAESDVESDDVIPAEEEKKEPLDIMTIGIYTGVAFLAILTVLVIVMGVERCRVRRRQITEVVELKPIDLDAHKKGIAARNRKKMIV